jgi:hypothetical protein
LLSNKRIEDTVFEILLFIDDEDCPECDEILEHLEQIDGDADLYGMSSLRMYVVHCTE